MIFRRTIRIPLSGIGNQAKVARAELSELPLNKGSEPPKAERVYKVTFKTTMDPRLGPLIIYVDGDTKEVLGYGLRF